MSNSICQISRQIRIETLCNYIPRYALASPVWSWPKTDAFGLARSEGIEPESCRIM